MRSLGRRWSPGASRGCSAFSKKKDAWIFPKEVAVGRLPGKQAVTFQKWGGGGERKRKIRQMKAGTVPKVPSIYDFTRSTIIPTATST